MRFKGHFIDGRFHPARGGRRIVVEDPGDLDAPVGEIRSSPGAVDEALRAARRAFAAWRSRSMEDRLAFLRRYQALLTERAAELARTISRETGKPLSESDAEVRAMAAKVDVTAREGWTLVAERTFPMPDGARGRLSHRPLGVVAVIGPFNVPGHLPNGQVVPALLTGNTVVFKPSELTPFTGQLMAECLAAAGLPPGVFNLVQGGGDIGARLAAAAPDVLFFTGSAATGDRLRLACAGQKTLLALEMGGKNAALVCPDADLDLAVAEVLQGAFATSGQRCSSTSRVIVHRAVLAPFLKKFLAGVDRLTVGYFTDNPSMGPLINRAAVERFLRAQKTAVRLGYRALRPGRAADGPRRGHYVSASVHLWPRALDRLPRRSPAYWDEELFAPDVAIYPARDEAAMAAFNNASGYGLAAAVFTRSEAAYLRLRSALDNGVVHWNRSTAMTPGLLPFGGTKSSGNHRPAGLSAILACVSPIGSVEKNPT